MTAKSDQEKGTGIGKIFGLVAVLTVLSKLAGLARDIVILDAFGTSYIADAYNYAYLLTGNILILFGGLGGPFHSSTVAILTPRKSEPGSGRLVGQIFLITIVILLAATALLWFFAPNLIEILAPSQGHTPEYRTMLWGETLAQLKIMLPLLVIAGMMGISYGVLNVYGKFFWPSIAPSITSLSIIVAVMGFADTTGGLCLAMGTLVGACGQLVVQIPGMLKSGLKYGAPLKPQPGLSDFTTMLWPAAVSTSVGQLTIYVDSFFTSRLQEGAWTAIVNANRLIQLPLGILLTAMIVPILPRFTEQVAAKKIDELKDELRRALRFLWFLALPLAALLFVLAGPVVQVLFERGQFDETSRILVTTALLFLVPSIFFYVARDLITRVFYAHHDSQTPYRIAMMAIFVKILLDWALVGPLGVGGITLATTVVTVFNLSLLTFFIRKRIGRLGTSSLVKPVGIMLLSSLATGLVGLKMHNWLLTLMPPGHFVSIFLALAIASSTALVLYFGICTFFHLEEPRQLIRRLKLALDRSGRSSE